MVGAPNPGSFWACSGPDIRYEDTGDGEKPNATNPYRLVLSPVHLPVLCGRSFLLTGKGTGIRMNIGQDGGDQ